MHVVGTAGHVDHGKSTLVRALTGIDPDRFEEEKRRGLTIDLGFAWRTLPSGREIGIVDVPGHERFIRNMLAGVGAIDVVLFVVAADEGWMPQSAEHLLVLDFLKVRSGVVALTKSDLVSDEGAELVRDDIRAHLRGTCLADAPIVGVSAVTGDGIDKLLAALDELLGRTPGARDRGRPRMFVDRSFTIAGAGTVVTGTLTGGSLRVGEVVSVSPDGSAGRVRSLQTHQRSVDVAVPGSRVAANLVGLERVDVVRGDAIVRSGDWLETDTFVARLEAAASIDHAFTERGAYELYIGSAELACRVKFLEERSETAIVPVSSDGGLSAGIRPGAGLLVQVFCDRLLPLVPTDRFVIRDVGRRKTVAGGVVLDVRPRAIKRGNEAELARLRAREGLGPIDVARRIVSERGTVRADVLMTEAGVTGAELAQASWDDVERVGALYVEARHLAAVRERALAIVKRHHEEHPLDRGIPRDALTRALGDDASPLLDLWARDATLVVDGHAVRLPSHGTGLPAADREAADLVLEELRQGGSSPPTLSDLSVPIALAKAMERAGEIVLVSPAIAYTADVWREIEKRVVELVATAGPVTVSQVREAIGTTRKYAVPLLETLDASGVTRRNGDARELGPRGRELAESR